jgi:hypothetical protein
MLNTKGPPPPPSPPPASGGPTTSGCGQTLSTTYYAAKIDQLEWRENDFDDMADRKINLVKESANNLITSIRGDIKEAQDSWHKADVEVNNYQIKKKQGALVDPDLLEMAQEERQEKWEELQRQKGRLEKAEAWRSQKIREIWALRDRAKNGDYLGYRGLAGYDYTIPYGMLK